MTDGPVTGFMITGTGIPIFPAGMVKPYTTPKSFMDGLDLS